MAQKNPVMELREKKTIANSVDSWGRFGAIPKKLCPIIGYVPNGT